METLTKIQAILRNTFDDNSLVINELSSANDINGWDSLMHMTIINEIETNFSIQFSFDDVSEFKTIGDIINCIQKAKK